MEIPGLSPLSNQSTLTNPLNQNEKLQGQQTQAQSESETKNTTNASEQANTSLSNIEVVNQANEIEEKAVNSPSNSRLGATVDITV